jgi:hypothetical protein
VNMAPQPMKHVANSGAIPYCLDPNGNIPPHGVTIALPVRSSR